ncbi:MarR family winged helix-turn-helix transcriptional regulator [Nocardia sp. NBC_00511]|uniref:MarR family winged helix-turn-helix transcriptional regulator n=1 Tax=Nocardia sp. NBC_00511 TaxID=2903591 RepID=UPI0030E473F8
MGSIEERLGAAVQHYQSTVDDFDRELARLLGVNETDLRCLEILLTGDGVAPGELGDRLGLTTGSVTAMLDRLEKLQFLTRAPHPTDRRKVVVHITPDATVRAYGLMTPFLDEAGRRVLDRYTPEQLELIVDFLTFNRDIQDQHVQRLRELPTPTSRRAKSARGAAKQLENQAD